MKYMGSKSRIAKSIVPIIQDKIAANNIDVYIEPFCGGCNIIDKIQCKVKIASDKHKYLMEMFKNLEKIKELPHAVTKEHYSDVRECFNKNLDTYPAWYVGAVGFLSSYNGRFFDGGYAGTVHTKAGTTRNYYVEAKRNLVKQAPALANIEFRHCDYSEYDGYENSMFYCDIPYYGTKQYGISKDFDYARFWRWAEKMSGKNIVLVSEHKAPEGWECIWEQSVKRTIDNTKRVDTVERLFQIKN